jgi:hypothetical protein
MGRSSFVLALLVLVPGLAAIAVFNPAPAIARSSIHVKITGENHHPVVGKNWTYSVTVTNAKGQKLAGTETTHYLYDGSVVGTEKPENVHFKNGRYRDTIQFPATAVGEPLAVEAVVKTKDGSGQAAWSITVKQ